MRGSRSTRRSVASAATGGGVATQRGPGKWRGFLWNLGGWYAGSGEPGLGPGCLLRARRIFSGQGPSLRFSSSKLCVFFLHLTAKGSPNLKRLIGGSEGRRSVLSGTLIQGTEPPMGTGDGDDPRSPANRGWGWGWTPDPRQIGDGGGDGPPIVGVCRAAALNG